MAVARIPGRDPLVGMQTAVPLGPRSTRLLRPRPCRRASCSARPLGSPSSTRLPLSVATPISTTHFAKERLAAAVPPAHLEGPLALAGGAAAQLDLAISRLEVRPQHGATLKAVVKGALQLGVHAGAPGDHAVHTHQLVEVEVAAGGEGWRGATGPGQG